MEQPTPPAPPLTHYEQRLAALDAARYMAGHIAPDDMPKGIEAAARVTFAAAGLPDVFGVVLHSVPTVEALERIRTSFGGEVTRTRRASSDTGWAYTEHELVGSVRGVPYLASVTTEHERIPVLRTGRLAVTQAPSPDVAVAE